MNFVIIYLDKKKINVKIPNWILNQTFHLIFENPHQKNLSDILFSDKLQNLHKYPLNIVWTTVFNILINKNGEIVDKNLFFVQLLAEKLNATLNFIEIVKNHKPGDQIFLMESVDMRELFKYDLIDFYLRSVIQNGDLKLYETEDYCFIVSLPPKYSIVEMILILPFDKSVWMWLGIVAGVSTIIWRFYGIFEGSSSHWNFLFVIFAFFVGHSVKI